MKRIFLSLIAVSAAVPALALAAIKSADDVITLITKAGGWLYSALVALAVVVIVYGAFEILFAGGDSEKVKKGKNVILYAVAAVAIAILATGIIVLVKELLGVAKIPAPEEPTQLPQ